MDNTNPEQSIILRIKTDTSEALNDVDKLKGKLDDIDNKPIGEQSVKSLKQLFREATQEAQRLAATGQMNSKAFTYAATRVAEYRDQIEAYNRTIEAFNPDNKLSGIIGVAKAATSAIQGISGALTLVGVDSDSAAKAIAQLQGILAIKDSLKDLQDYWKAYILRVNAARTATVAEAEAQEGATIATKGFGLALKGIGIGLIVAAIAYLVTNWDSLKKSVTDLFPGLSKTGELFDKVKAVVVGFGGAIVKYAITPVKALIDVIKGDFKGAMNDVKDGFDVVGNTEKGYQEQRQKQAEDAAVDKLKIDIKSKEDAVKLLKANGQETTNLEREILKNKIQVEKEGSDERKEAVIALSEFELSTAKKKRDDNKKDADDAKKKAKEASDKLAQEKKEREGVLNDLDGYYGKVYDLLTESQQETLKSTLDARSAELDAVKDTANKKIEELQKGFDEEQKKLKEARGKGLLSEKEYQADLLKMKSENATVISSINDAEKAGESTVNKKYDDQINQFLKQADQEMESEFQKKRSDLKKQYEELMKIATGEDQKLALTTAYKKADTNLSDEEKLTDSNDKSQNKLKKADKDDTIKDDDTIEARKQKIANLADVQKEAEDAAYQLRLKQLQDQHKSTEDLEREHADNLVQIENERSNTIRTIDAEDRKQKLEMYESVGSALVSLGSLFGKQTVAYKATAAAQAIINTWLGVTEVLKAKSVLPEPAATIAKVANTAVIIGSGLSALKNILKADTSGGSSGSIGSTSGASVTAPSINTTQLQQAQIQNVRVTNPENQVVKAYITDKDLKDNEQRTNFINNLRNF